VKHLLLISVFIFFSHNVNATEYIIKFKSSINQNSLQTLETLNVKIVSTIPQLNMAVASGSLQNLKALTNEHSSVIEYIEKNGIIKLDDSPQLFGGSWENEAKQMWNMEAIKLKDAFKITHGDRNVIVAVSDTGTYLEHRELKDNLWKNKGEIGLDAQGKDKSKNKIDDDGNGYVDDVFGYNFEANSSLPRENHYHGTHVAGTIGALGGNGSIIGVSGNVSLMTVKFIAPNGEGSDAAAIKSIVYAVDNGARVINCSWGTSEFVQSLYDAIVYAQKKGVLIVAAAGNSGKNHDKYPHYPSGFDLANVISVTATNNAGGKLAYFSNYGAATVSIAAPGDRVNSTFSPMYQTTSCGSGSGLSHYYCELSGTSMAAPHVTGALAMVYAVNPKLNYIQARDIVLSTASPSIHLKDKVITGGQLDVAAAVKKAQTTLK